MILSHFIYKTHIKTIILPTLRSCHGSSY